MVGPFVCRSQNEWGFFFFLINFFKCFFQFHLPNNPLTPSSCLKHRTKRAVVNNQGPVCLAGLRHKHTPAIADNKPLDCTTFVYKLHLYLNIPGKLILNKWNWKAIHFFHSWLSVFTRQKIFFLFVVDAHDCI